MTTSTLFEFSSLLEPRLAPLFAVGTAITLTLVFHILRVGAGKIFLSAGLFLLLGFAAGFLDPTPIAFATTHLIFDGVAHIGVQLLLPAVLIISAMSYFKMSDYHHKVGSLLLILISALGAIITLGSADWMMFFVAISCMSLPIYGLLAFDTSDKDSISSAVRYLVLSLIAMAFLLFGIMLLYAGLGTMEISLQAILLRETWASPLGLVHLGLAFVLIGIAFKLSLCPFHFWAPEVYQGAPLFVVGYMVVVVKGVLVLFFLRTFSIIFGEESSSAEMVISLLAITSMWVGNGLMLFEKNFMRFLAFMSIGHLGVLMIPLLAQSQNGFDAICLDLAAFGLAMLLVIASSRALARNNSSFLIDDFRGFLVKHPWHGIPLMIALMSLAGVPLTAGFIGKYAIFTSGVDKAMWSVLVHMVLSGILGFFAIARIVVLMLQTPANSDSKNLGKNGLFVAGALALVFFGMLPQPWVAWIKNNAVMVNTSSDIAQAVDKADNETISSSALVPRR